MNQFLNGFFLLLGISAAASGLALFGNGICRLQKEAVRPGRILAFGQGFFWRRWSLGYYRWRWKLDASMDDERLSAAIRVFGRINAWTGIFTGPAITIIPLIWLSVSWLKRGDFLLIGIFNLWAFLISLIIPVLILSCVGRAYGVRRLRANAINHPAFGDLSPRRLRNYAPIWAGIAFAISFLMLVILTAIALRYTKTPLQIPFGLVDLQIYLPCGRLMLLAIPLLVVLSLILGLWLLHWMVALPRLKSLDEIPDIEVFDQPFRWEFIQFVLTEYSILMQFSLSSQYWLITQNMPRLPRSVVPMFFLFTIFLAAMILHMILIIGLFNDKATGSLRRGATPPAVL
jgi:hypothetical protein